MYFGNEGIVGSVEDYIRDFRNPDKKPVMLTGNPGVGKTYMTTHLARKMGIKRIIINASATRKKEDIERIIEISQLNFQQFIVLDECEGMQAKDIIKIIKSANCAIILCCNYIDKIKPEVKKECALFKLKSPPYFTYIEFIESHRMGVSKETVVEIAKMATSYRHCEMLMDEALDGVVLNSINDIDCISTQTAMIKALNTGYNITEQSKIKPETLIVYGFDNTKIQNKSNHLSYGNIFMEHNYLDGKSHLKYFYDLMRLLECGQKLEYPKTFKIMSRMKGNNKKIPEQERTNKTIGLDLKQFEGMKIEVRSISQLIQSHNDLMENW